MHTCCTCVLSGLAKRAKVVPPSTPRVQDGLYWGYTVRFAHTFGAVFTQCPFEVSRVTTVLSAPHTIQMGLPNSYVVLFCLVGPCSVPNMFIHTYNLH